MKPSQVYIVCCLLLIIESVRLDKVEDVKRKDKKEPEKPVEPVDDRDFEALRKFFSLSGVRMGAGDSKLVSLYDKDLLKKMRGLLGGKTDEHSIAEVNTEVNSKIYERELKKAKKESGSSPEYANIKAEDAALLRALDLIVPSVESEPVYRLAKDELRKFYKEQPELAQELLGRVKISIEVGLHSFEAARYMRNFYYHWIPLARLVSYIEKNSPNL